MVEPSLMAMAMAYPPPQQHGLRIAPPRPPETPLNRCWGAELKGGDATTCQPGFQCGKVHFKNKFCSCCRAGIDVPASRIRPLSPELQIAFANSQSEGFWKTGPSHLGGGMLRIINNTAACVGPWLAIYRSEPPALQWGEIPAKWVMDGYVRLCVAKGTLVPDLELRGKSLMRKRDGFAPLPHPAKCVRLEDHSGLLAHAASVAAPVMAVATQQLLAIENSDGSSTTVEADGRKVAMPYASAYSGEAGVPMAMPAYGHANGAYSDATATVTGHHPHPPGTRLASHESRSPAPRPSPPHPPPAPPAPPPHPRASRRPPASCSPPPSCCLVRSGHGHAGEQPAPLLAPPYLHPRVRARALQPGGPRRGASLRAGRDADLGARDALGAPAALLRRAPRRQRRPSRARGARERGRKRGARWARKRLRRPARGMTSGVRTHGRPASMTDDRTCGCFFRPGLDPPPPPSRMLFSSPRPPCLPRRWP